MHLLCLETETKQCKQTNTLNLQATTTVINTIFYLLIVPSCDVMTLRNIYIYIILNLILLDLIYFHDFRNSHGGF